MSLINQVASPKESWATFRQLTRLLFKCVRVVLGKICFQRKGGLGELGSSKEIPRLLGSVCTLSVGLTLGASLSSQLAGIIRILRQFWVPFLKNLTNKRQKELLCRVSAPQ